MFHQNQHSFYSQDSNKLQVLLNAARFLNMPLHIMIQDVNAISRDVNALSAALAQHQTNPRTRVALIQQAAAYLSALPEALIQASINHQLSLPHTTYTARFHTTPPASYHTPTHYHGHGDNHGRTHTRR